MGGARDSVFRETERRGLSLSCTGLTSRELDLTKLGDPS